ncbi:MAG: alpha/beta hydrolase-fold protein [Ginsengibacter sp.]
MRNNFYRRKIIQLIFCFLLTTTSKATFSQSSEVSIPGSQTKTFTSKIISGQEYVLQISLPAGYSKSSKQYPVVYLMDSQWDFPLLAALYGQQYFDGFVPELIIVGITWCGDHPNPDSLRARDYTPTKEQRLPQSGGADNFLSVIKNEVFPLVENNFRTDKIDKTLVGCSLGGLFTMYTLFTHSGMFHRYIAASPAFTWDDNVLYKFEEKYHSNIPNPPADLFMCVGGVELSVSAFEKLTSFLANRHYTHLQIESKVLENTGHSGTKGIGYEKGLQYVFRRPSLQLSTNILQQYKGTYKLNDGTVVEIKTENGSLTAMAGNNAFKLFAASDTDFYLTASFFKMHFNIDEKGKVYGFQLDRYGASEMANKIK